jgi:hypothetical protein
MSIHMARVRFSVLRLLKPSLTKSWLGIEVSNDMEDGMLNRVTFIPWGAVLSIRGTTETERVGGVGGRLTKEQVAQLAMRDNV